MTGGKNRYKQSGVDINAGQRAVDLMREAVHSTYGPQVLSDTGSFGGLYDAGLLRSMERPVLVASTDGVGTKTRVAARLGRWETIGQDLVNHCINDILVQGARPLFFLDYVASARLVPEQVAAIVNGMAAACRAAGCALLGGETAEMPGIYETGEVDIVGTIVGAVERQHLLTGKAIRPGHSILALSSSGLHTNGFSLARTVLDELDWDSMHPELGQSIGDALLEVHRSYLEPVQMLRQAGVPVDGLAHITGGGVTDNLPRILPQGTGAVIRRGSWPEPPIFGLIQRLGDIDADEMFRAFNMGLGMLVVVPSEAAEQAGVVLEGACYVVGQVVEDERRVSIQ